MIVNFIEINTALDYVKYTDAIAKIAENYPFLSVMKIGKSVMGKNLYALQIGQGYETVLFAAAFHGSEHITTNISRLERKKYCNNASRKSRRM